MRYFRRLPPLLRVASLLGLLFPLASILLFAELFATSLSSSVDSSRVAMIALNLAMLGGACSVAVTTYSTRFRQPDPEPFPLSSWQSQVRTLVLLAALPSCALVLAVFIPSTALAFALVFLVSILAAGVLFVASLVDATRSRPMRTPRA